MITYVNYRDQVFSSISIELKKKKTERKKERKEEKQQQQKKQTVHTRLDCSGVQSSTPCGVGHSRWTSYAPLRSANGLRRKRRTGLEPSHDHVITVGCS